MPAIPASQFITLVGIRARASKRLCMNPPCNICGTAATRLADEVQNHGTAPLCYCDDCAFAFFPCVEAEAATQYTRAYYDAEDAFARPDTAILYGELQSLIGQRPPLLDFGCGRGHYVAAGRIRGVEVFGLDVCPADCSAHPELYEQGVIRRGLLTESPLFPPDYFGTVFAVAVLEHLGDLVGNLKALHRLMQPGAAIFATTLLWDCPESLRCRVTARMVLGGVRRSWQRMLRGERIELVTSEYVDARRTPAQLADWWYVTDRATHVSFPSTQTIRRLAAQTGFEVQSYRPIILRKPA